MAGIVSTEPDHREVNGFARAGIIDLRRREQAFDEVHRIADFVSTRLISVDEITNGVRVMLYREAMEHFGAVLARPLIREFVDAAVLAEIDSRKPKKRAAR
jgi:hypothetical protein